MTRCFAERMARDGMLGMAVVIVALGFSGLGQPI